MKRFWLAAGMWALPALAGTITVHVGPPAVGNGGPNPISIPPVRGVEYELQYCTDSGTEWNLAATPGVLVGGRSVFANKYYASLGGGFVLDANGSGPGVYSSIGANLEWFNIEFKQAVGFDYETNQLISPYAIRIGVTLKI